MTVLEVSAVVAASVMTATPLNSAPFYDILITWLSRAECNLVLELKWHLIDPDVACREKGLTGQ